MGKLSGSRPGHFALGVQTCIGNYQFVDDPAADDGFVHDAGSILAAHMTVPDSLRVDHNGRPVFALIETTSTIGAHQSIDLATFQGGLKGAAQDGRTTRR